jgi:hypothetical protein
MREFHLRLSQRVLRELAIGDAFDERDEELLRTAAAGHNEPAGVHPDDAAILAPVALLQVVVSACSRDEFRH